ncbi:hypothetical protein D3C81_1646490 [compost metagenome]
MAGNHADGPHTRCQADHDFGASSRDQITAGIRHEIDQAGDGLHFGSGTDISSEFESPHCAAPRAVDIEHDVFNHRVRDRRVQRSAQSFVAGHRFASIQVTAAAHQYAMDRDHLNACLGDSSAALLFAALLLNLVILIVMEQPWVSSCTAPA